MSDTRLKPCPFCGGEMKFNKILTLFICDECKVHIGFPNCYSDKNRFQKVNTRKPIDRMVEQLEEQKELNDEHYNLSVYKDLPEIKTRYEIVTNYLNEAINIVKAGGIDG